ncbi:MAG: pyridoxamine 5'-phosphate oxidase family protein [Bacteroidia bacterium]
MNSLIAKIESLADLHQVCWDQLQTACVDKNHPMREISLATIGEKQSIEQRMVVLRQAERQDRSLITYTDIRANKVAELRQNPQIHYLAWHPKLRLQIRLQGSASLHYDDEIQRSAWQELSYFARTLYSAKIAPGKNIFDFQMGVDAYLHSSEAETEPWRQNFVLVKAQIHRLECLVLGREKQLRARFEYNQEPYQANWLVP